MSDDEFDTSEGFDLSTWLSLWSYEKFHSIGIGAGLAFLAAVSASAYLLGAYLAILFWALGIRGSPFRSTRTGDKCDEDGDAEHHDAPGDLEEVVAERSDDHGSGMHAQLLAEIRRKPHYYGIGGLLGDRFGYGVYYLIHGVGPEHYEHLPDVVRLLLGGF